MKWRTRTPFVLERLERGVLRTAHGGASWEASPNTLQAVQRAVAAKPDFIELDVHQSQDGQLVLWHDPVIVTPQDIHVIAQTSLATLRQLPLPDGQLMTLEEAIEEMRGQCGVMIDLKAPALETLIQDLLAHLNFQDVIVCGGYSSTLENLKAVAPHLTVSLTPNEKQYRNLREVIETAEWLDALTVYWRAVNTEMVQTAHEAGATILAWTVDYSHVAQHLMVLGVDGLTSNNMALLQQQRVLSV